MRTRSRLADEAADLSGPPGGFRVLRTAVRKSVSATTRADALADVRRGGWRRCRAPERQPRPDCGQVLMRAGKRTSAILQRASKHEHEHCPSENATLQTKRRWWERVLGMSQLQRDRNDRHQGTTVCSDPVSLTATTKRYRPVFARRLTSLIQSRMRSSESTLRVPSNVWPTGTRPSPNELNSRSNDSA